MKVEAGKHVHIHYTLKNDAGDVLDSSEGRGAATNQNFSPVLTTIVYDKYFYVTEKP